MARGRTMRRDKHRDANDKIPLNRSCGTEGTSDLTAPVLEEESDLVDQDELNAWNTEYVSRAWNKESTDDFLDGKEQGIEVGYSPSLLKYQPALSDTTTDDGRVGFDTVMDSALGQLPEDSASTGDDESMGAAYMERILSVYPVKPTPKKLAAAVWSEDKPFDEESLKDPGEGIEVVAGSEPSSKDTTKSAPDDSPYAFRGYTPNDEPKNSGRRRRLCILLVVLAALLILLVGLGAGIGARNKRQRDENEIIGVEKPDNGTNSPIATPPIDGPTTDSPVASPTSFTPVPTVAVPSPSPSFMPLQTAPPDCNNRIARDANCYVQSSAIINVDFQNCKPDPFDWIGIYAFDVRVGFDPTRLGDDYAGWSWTCGDQTCFGSPILNALSIPVQGLLAPGSHKAVLMRPRENPLDEIFAPIVESATFWIDATCAGSFRRD